MTRRAEREPVDEEGQVQRNYKAWEILREIDGVLAQALAGRSTGRRGFKSAGDVWEYGRDKGWVASV